MECLFENLSHVYSFKVLNVRHFTTLNKKNDPLFQNIVLFNEKINIYSYLKIQILYLLSKLPVRIKRSEFLAVNNDIQKLSF